MTTRTEHPNAITHLIERIIELFEHSVLLLAQEFFYTEYDWRIGVLNRKPILTGIVIPERMPNSADRVIEMLKGAMAECRLGNPERLSVDIGPVIDM